MDERIVYGCEGADSARPEDIVEIDGVLTYTCPSCKAELAQLMAEAA